MRYSVIFVFKKNDKWWLCINYQKLNTITWKNRYLLSLIKKLQEQLKKVKWFMKLDIWEKYYKICIKKKEKWKTAFQTKYELYEYQIILFELTNTSAIFQELINHVLYDHLNEFVIAYLNNILIYFKNEENHKKHVKEVLKRLQKKNSISNQKNANFTNNKSNI